jgi:plasmid stability protein
MPVSITLKNIPDALYQSLKHSAERNRRSLNMEAITVLEQGLAPKQAISVEERIARAKALRASIGPDFTTTPEEIDAFKKEGRK